MDPEQINNKLKGFLDPGITGFKITDISAGSMDAASSGVDFSSLFLSLSMFILTSCIILLSLAVSMYFDSRKEQVRTYYALGFKNSFIRNQLFLESLLQTVAGAVSGILGYLINTLIINALNSVWIGAVQTDTLTPHFGAFPLISGFVTTILISGLLLLIRSGRYLKELKDPGTKGLNIRRSGRNLNFVLLSFIAALITLAMSLIFQNYSIVLSFVAGALFFAALIMSLRQYYLRVISRLIIKSMLRINIPEILLIQSGSAVTPAFLWRPGYLRLVMQDRTGRAKREHAASSRRYRRVSVMDGIGHSG
jgi:predicted lysophospholipase L1 biosynthesis ABC-type transport system permease subunit